MQEKCLQKGCGRDANLFREGHRNCTDAWIRGTVLSNPDLGYRDAETLRAACERYGWNAPEVAEHFGISTSTVFKWRRILGVDMPPHLAAMRTIVSRRDYRAGKFNGGPAYVGQETAERAARERSDTGSRVSTLTDTVLKELKSAGAATILTLCDKLDLAPKRVRDAIEEAEAAGYSVSIEDDTAVLTTNTRMAPLPPTERLTKKYFDGDTYEFAVVSDIHLGSKHDNVAALTLAYQMIADYGITDVINPGDLVCGKGIYRGQVNDIRVHTYEEQVEYALDNHPAIDGVRTLIIAGNHDIEGDFGQVGANPVRAFCAERDDFEYLGDYSAWIELPNGARMHILHPRGGGGYAMTYRMQKIVEGYEGGLKPNVLLCGHWHRRCHTGIRGVECFMTGTLEGQSNLGTRLGLGEPDVGFYRVKLRLGDDGSVVKAESEWHKFYRGRFL